MAGGSKKMTNSELEKSLKDISDIVSRQKAEIERLTEENKKLVEEIDLEVDLQTKRKRQIITESQEFIDELVNKNAELQKQVDELKELNAKYLLVEKSANNSFLKIQQKRLTQLKEIESNKQKGKRIQKSRIVKELQSSGILDSKGNLSKHYFSED